VIATARLDLVPATVPLTEVALTGGSALGAALHVDVPATWPPELLDEGPLRFTLAKLREGPGQAGWWLYFVVLRGVGRARTLIGSAGYKGPPTRDGTVEVGYGIVEGYRRRGYASETTRALVAHAFEYPVVQQVVAETYPELIASIGVMTSCGFAFVGAGSEPGVIRYALARKAFQHRLR
jgi:RimJ/RimL family protein N-acetyltransferase